MVNGEHVLKRFLDGFIADNKDFQKDVAHYMLACPSCNRAKSWSCEHCENWKTIKNEQICLQCYWGHPEQYTHIALVEMRKVELIWQGTEICIFEQLAQLAPPLSIADYIKQLLKQHLKISN